MYAEDEDQECEVTDVQAEGESEGTEPTETPGTTAGSHWMAITSFGPSWRICIHMTADYVAVLLRSMCISPRLLP